MNRWGYHDNLPSKAFLSSINSLKALSSNDKETKNLVDNFWEARNLKVRNRAYEKKMLDKIIYVAEKEGFKNITKKRRRKLVQAFILVCLGFMF